MATMKGGKKFSKLLQEISGQLAGGEKTVRVGFLENATYPKGMQVAMVAVFNEFGTATAPPRPFFRNMIRAKQGEWPAAIAGLLKANGYDVEKTLNITGAAIAGQLKQSIIDTNSPPLAASTIKRKGFAKPLIFTSHMINSVDYEVKS